jgi:hypothetical protein
MADPRFLEAKRMNPTKALMVTAMLISGSQAVGASNVPSGLDAARKDLALAVQARDLKRIVALADFPLAVEGFGAAPTITAQQFLTDKRKFDDLFGPPDAGIVGCIRGEALQRQDDEKSFGHGFWYIDCNGNEFFFTVRGGKWLFVGYENINE